MPKNTFLNLPGDKKERIIDCAVEEFAHYTYHKASITRIVKNAEIAKGSFYQYFEDKKDIFKYIIDISSEKKMNYLQEQMAKMDEKDFFNTVRSLYIAGIKFARDNPRLAAIGNNFMKNEDTNLREEILGSSIPKSNSFFESLLQKGIENGDIDPGINLELVAFLFTTTSISISDYFIEEINPDNEEEIMKFVDEMLYVFKNGIRSKKED